MPRRRTAVSSFHIVQGRARRLLGSLLKEIVTRETELRRLRETASTLAQLAGGSGAPRADGGAAKRGSRINWRAVLAQLPKQFKAADIRSVRGIRSKRSSEIFAGIARWLDAGLVERKSRGLYERVNLK
jgi:hypothetical protein